jgi:hypothetical protein
MTKNKQLDKALEELMLSVTIAAIYAYVQSDMVNNEQEFQAVIDKALERVTAARKRIHEIKGEIF